MSAEFANSFAALEQPGGLETVLLNAGDIQLLAEINEAADKLRMAPNAFASLAIRRFMERAGDEDWASLTSDANRNADALGSVVATILRKAVDDVKEIPP